MGHTTYCLMCLGRGVRMYQMNCLMKTMYNELVSTANTGNLKQMYACYECAYLLQKYVRFKTKCCKAFNILCSLSPEALQVTEEDLDRIDRKKYELVSQLSSVTYCYDYQPNQKEFGLDEYNIEKVKPDPNKLTDDENDPLQALQVHNTNTLEYHTVIKKECQLLDIKTASEQDVENGYQFPHIFQGESSNCKTDSDGMLWISIESKDSNEVWNNKTLQTPQHIDQGCFDTVHHDYLNEYLVDQKHDINIEPEENIETKIEKRKRVKKVKLEKKKDNNVDDSKKRKNVIKKSANRSNDDSDNDKNGLLTLDSKIFQDHMTIIEMTPDEARREILLRKKSSNYTRNPFKCDFCYRGFLTKPSYESHLKKHSLKNGEYQCDICKLCYIGQSYLTQHRIRMHKRKFSCKLCPYVCFAPTQCTAHILSHTGKKYICKICGMTYSYRNSLLTHMHLKHSVECVCDFCGSTFASENGLFNHKHIVHRQETNEHLGPRCDECDVHFASELAWKRHRVLCSRHQVQFGCRVCGDEFQDADRLRAHARVHYTKQFSARKEYMVKTCMFCKIGLPDNAALKKHLISVHPNENFGDLDKPDTMNANDTSYVCEYCGKEFAKRGLLDFHLKQHSDDMPYSCPDCGKRSKYKHTLAIHRRTHTDEYLDRFVCDLCGRPFSDKGRLVRHMKGHMGMRPHKCVACDKTFMFPCDVRNHYKHVHDKIPYPKKNECKTSRRKAPRSKLIQMINSI